MDFTPSLFYNSNGLSFRAFEAKLQIAQNGSIVASVNLNSLITVAGIVFLMDSNKDFWIATSKEVIKIEGEALGKYKP